MNKNYRPSKLPLINLILILIVYAVALPGMYLLARSASRAVPGEVSSSGNDGVLGSGDTLINYADTVNLESLQNSYRSIAKVVLPEVVQVNVEEVVTAPAPASPFDFGFGRPGLPDQQYTERGLGSGVIVRKSGKTMYVLTNNHVAGNAEEIAVKLFNGREYKAELVGADEYKDLALISFVSDQDIPVAELGDSSTLQPGDIVLAVGNPLGFASTITAGIVSAVGRSAEAGTEVASFTDYIQTDASINQGNSGGALVNLKGQVIGINSWIASTSGGSIGIGFAIPINNAKRAIDDFITKGKVEYGWLGINSSDPPEEVVEAMELKDTAGTFVIDVYTGSPADEAGIVPGDFITTLGGRKITDSNSIVLIIGGLSPGQSVPLSLVRQGKTLNLTVKIGLRPGQNEVSGDADRLWPGFLVLPVTEEIEGQLGISGAGRLLIVNVEEGTPAQEAGLRTGDLILSVNGRRVEEMNDFYREFNAAAGKPVTLVLERNGVEGKAELTR